MSNIPKISVIVPVYKVEEYIDKCIGSILGQTYTDFELLLIDDGSPDNSGKICDEYAAKDIRVRVFHKENGGVSSARNYGINNAHGEYLAFIDSDDYVGIDYLSNFSTSTVEADLHMQGYQLINTITGSRVFYKFDETNFYKDITYPYLFSERNSVILSPYVKLFKRGIVSDFDIRFDHNLTNGEDLIFVLNYMLHIRTVFISNTAAYHYLVRSGESLSKRYLPFDEMQEYAFRVYELRNQIIQHHNIVNPACQEYVDYRLSNAYLLAVMSLYDHRSLLTKKDRALILQKCLEFVENTPLIKLTKQKTLFMNIWCFLVTSNIPLKDFILSLVLRLRSFIK